MFEPEIDAFGSKPEIRYFPDRPAETDEADSILSALPLVIKDAGGRLTAENATDILTAAAILAGVRDSRVV